MKPVPRDARLLSLAVLAAAAACTRNSTLDQPSLHAAGLDAAALAPQPSVLLADIYPGGTAASSNPAGLVAAGSTLYFRATTAVAGAELWKSDGTAAGTVAVQDLSPLGVNGSSPWCLTYFGGALYFAASDSASTSGFFRSDGTADGTVLIKRISLGSACIVASGGVMFFPASTAASGEELWRSDGTPEGTFLVQDLNPGAASSSPSDLASAGGVVYFAATTVSAGRELWKSDGTSAGTSMVTDLAPGPASSSPHSLRVFGSSVLFAATDGVSGVELWSSDGTTGGTKLLADVAPGATSASPWPLGVVGGKLLFTADDYASGMELWASDGTPAGTALLKDINPGANGSSLSPLAASGGLLYFRASDGVTGTELWKTDGTAEGTLLVKDIFPGVGGSSPTGGVDLGGTLVFAAAGTAGDTELWRSDGTAAGTFVVRDICAGTCSSSPSQLTVLGGSVYFSAADRVAGTELWKTDGTFAGTALVKNIEPGAFGSSPENLAALNGNIYFAAYNRSFGTELYRSDGATSSARLLTDLVSGAGSSSPTSLTAFNGRLLFFAVKADVGLWSTDGTAAGTVLVTTIQPSGTMMPSSLTALGSYALFAAGDGISSGTELWRTDGTAAGTYLLKDIYPGPMGSYPRAFVKLGGTSLFVASGDTGRSAMWSTDGTAAGTAMIADIRSCAGDAFSPTTFGTLLADVLYFAADDCSHGWELWRTDGTTAGTWLVKDINPGVASSNPGFLVAIGGRLVFQANDGFHGAELWTSGGTAPDTTLLVDIVPGASGGTPSGMVAMGDWALFRARGRQELWRTDGTAAETLPIGEIGAGLDVAFISGFVRLPAPSTEAVFVAFERATGTELWVSDGTAAGTRLAADVLPGPLSSTPSALTVAGEHLFFTAMTDLGKEPWAVPLSDLDVTPPVITATVTGTQLANGWYVSDVTVSFSVTDPESMVLTAMNCGTITITQDMDQTLTCTATSTGGTNSASVAIRRDTKPPGFNCLGPAPVEATSSAGAAVDFEVPAYDISPTSSSYSLPPGSVFPVGTTMVDVTATDAVGLATLCSFPVTVIDTTPPAVTCGPDVVAEATGPDGAAVIYPPATVTDLVDASSTVAYSSPSGTVFPLGTWPVSVEASDAAGNCASCAFQVTVRDTTPPVAFCPPDVVAEADYPTGSFVPIPIPGFPYDAVDQVPGLTFSPDLDGQFAVGVTHVTGTATDFSGNSASCVFDVLVRDTRPPSISCRSFDVEAAAYCGALVDATASASDFVTVQPRITYSPALPAYLGLGTTSITAVATDQAGNSASCSSDVTVRDTRPPRFERCPDLKVEATSAAGAAVTYPLGSAVDAADPSLIYSYDPPSGSTLPRGTTLVKVDATDHSGNSVSCSFQVVVADTTGPKLTCPGNITASAASAEGAVVEYAALVEDAVDPYPTVQYDRASGTVFPFGDTTVRVDASDATGNTSSCTFVVTVTDTHAPTLACPSDIIAEATSADGAIVSYAAATATDDIDAVATLAYSRASGERFALGASPVGVTATDLAGNAASCSFTITVRDTTAPTLACGGSVSVPATSSLGALVDYPLATASDLVDAAPAIVYSVASGTVFPLGVTTVSVTASDATGNISTCELTVSVSDTAAPALVCPAAVTAEAEDATGAVVTYAPASVEDVVDASPIVTYSRDSGARFSIGTTSVTATAVDLAGNVATCTFAVTVRDATPPALSCPADVTAEATSAVGAVVTYAQAIVTDAVDPSPAIACDRDPGSTFPLGISPVTVAATDASGNTSTCGFDVVVLDSTPPTVGCPDDVVAEATHASGAVVTFAPAAVEDLVDPGPMVSYSQATATVFPLGATTVTVEASDGAANISTCTFSVTVRDSTAPAVTCPADVTVEAYDAGGAVAVFQAPAATDVVDPSPVVQSERLSGDLFPLGSTTVSAEARDASGNIASCSFAVNVRDAMPPVLLGCPQGALEAEATSAAGATVTFGPLVATDSVDASPTVTSSAAPNSVFAIGATRVVVLAADHAGNSARCEFDVVVRDRTPPTLTCPGNITTSATSAAGAIVDLGAPVVRDVVDASVVVAYDHESGEMFPLGMTSVNVTATDRGGNTATCSFVVTVQDTKGPTVVCPSDISAEATGADGAAVAFPPAQAVDDVDANVTLTYSQGSGDAFALGDSHVAVTARDAAGNTATCSFTIQVRDTTPPSVVCGGDVSTGATSAAGSVVDYAPARARDIVDPAPAIDYDHPSGSLFAVGTTTVTVVATDASGNAARCSSTVTVEDRTAPTIACPASIVAEASCASGARVTYPPASVSDLVDTSPHVSYDHATGDWYPLGTTMVIATATDLGGAGVNCSFGVTVRDTTPPALSCPGGITARADADGAAVDLPPLVAVDLVDLAPVVLYTGVPRARFPLGDTLVTATAADAAGNQATCSFVVSVRDLESPGLACPSDLVVEAAGAAGAIVTYPAAVVDDAIDPAPRVTYSLPDGAMFPLGTTTASATATDAGGNQASCDFHVTVRDTTPPVLVCPGPVHATAAPGRRVAVDFAPARVYDSVSPETSVVYSHSPGTAFPIGTTAVEVQATDASGNAAMCSFEIVVYSSEVVSRQRGCSSSSPSTLGLTALLLISLAVRRRWKTQGSAASR